MAFHMARHAIIPRTAPFGDTERASLDAVLGAASPIQRAWLAGFLAGLDASGTPQAAAVPAAPPKAAEPLTILFASESGNSEKLAGDMAKLARKNGFKPKIVDFADLEIASLAKEKRIVAFAATWGEGEPPARAVRAYNELMADGAPRLDGVSFGVLSLGDTSYAEFCAIGKALDARFEALGGTRAHERADLDLDFETPAAAWIKDTLKALTPPPSADNVVAVDFAARAAGDEDEDAEPSREPRIVEVVDHVNLNSSRSDKETIHLALEFEDGAPAYEPGDSLEIYPENDPALVDEILNATGLSGDAALRQALLAERDITTLSATTVERFVKATGHAEAQTLIDSGELRAWIEGRHLIDLITAYPAALTAEHLTTITRPLPPRAYSIASSRKEVGDEVHLVIAAVRYETHGRARGGVASTHVADRIKNGAKLRVKLKPNRHFRLPQDPATDIIMVGPGTGVAPFRAFVQERRAVEAPGRAWLFFGDRQFTHDFLYQLEWQEALEDGSLSQIDVAFSRDQPEKIYVQDRIAQHAKEVVAWLDGGASFYVCGDATRMAKDVRNAVVKAYQDVKALSPAEAEAAVAALERAHRYQQDVY
jgi:sulfite reductase (NADPH) flavoprotein alpha-component